MIDKKTDYIKNAHEYDVDLINNHIYLFGHEGYINEEGTEPGVEYVMANRFIRNMNLCMRTNPNKDIVIHMKTCGGDYHEGMAIYDSIKSCPNHVTIINYTSARSMSSLIIQAADLRLTTPHSYFMMHDGEIHIGGTVKQVNSYVEFSKVLDTTMMKIYIEVMREKGFLKTDEERYNWLRDKMDKKEEVYLTAEEAIEYGFIDKIYDGTI